MNPNPEHDPLLSAVLLDPELEGQLLGDVLDLARRRRRRRRTQRMAGIAAVAAILGWSALSLTRFRLGRGLTLSAWGTTRSTSIVSTVPFCSSVPLALPAYRVIGDRELLGLAQDRAGMLVQVGPGRERLVFP